MISGISKKFIYISFLFINFIQPAKSAASINTNIRLFDQSTKFSQTKIFNIKTQLKSLNFSSNENSDKVSVNKNFLNKPSGSLLASISQNQKEIIIQSDKQSEIDNIIFAEGNVSVTYRGKILESDSLIYDKSNKKISAKGNISLIINDQIFKASILEYSFISEKGYLLDVKGSINTGSLMDDLYSNFSPTDSNQLDSLFQLKKQEVFNTPGKVENWLFFTDKMTIDGKKWKSKKAIFTNDLLEFKQVKLAINSLEVISEAEKLLFKSSLNYLIFEDKVSIPFWLGNRTLYKYGGILNYENRWNLGYENLDKDGYFIGRKLNSIDIYDDFVLDLEPQFLIQRSLKGYTNSFVKKDESITADRVKRNTSFEDYFALKSQIKGKINNWDLVINKNLNSLDVDKFEQAFRLKTKLIKEIDLLGSKWNKSFYGIYRERVWNGSMGEAEIYSGYGSKLQKENTWNVNGIKKKEIISLGLANITAEALNTKNLVTNFKSNLFYALDQKFPISIEEPENRAIDISYRYIPEPITKGLSLNTRLEASYSLYENGDDQEYLGFGVGPELILGNFKNKTFDYTRLSLFPVYRMKSGESVFKFDQNSDKFTLDIALDQQLFGPIILKSFGTLNLTNDSNNYGEFINSKISLNWKKRAYEFAIFYQPHNQAGGISFNLFGFR